MHAKAVTLLFMSVLLLFLMGCTQKEEPDGITASDIVAGIPADEKNTKSELDYVYQEGTRTTTIATAIPETTTTTVTTATTVTSQQSFETTIPSTTTTTETIPNFTGTPGMYTSQEFQIQNLRISAISVNCLKITWDADAEDRNPNRDYNISYSTNAANPENIHFVFTDDNTVVYMTGLRENSAYNITVSPILTENDRGEVIPVSGVGYTENVEVIWNFDYEPGWTNCFAGERASGLTAQPSVGAIAGSIKDPITDTTIRRNEYGDYCVAMGTWYGYCGDRFLITLDNGIQFTVAICDSKGLADDGQGKYHWFGGEGNGKCIIEFIYHSDAELPNIVSRSGSWGGYNWNGLNLSANIASIQKINYGNPVTY